MSGKARLNVVAHNAPDPRDPEHAIDTRDLSILDALYAGKDPADAAKRFRLPERYARELWRIREAQAPVGEHA